MERLDYEGFLYSLDVSARGDKNQKYCFILGAGCSASSGFPTGSELAWKWFQELMEQNEEWKRCTPRVRNAIINASERDSTRIIVDYLQQQGMLETLLELPLATPNRFPSFQDLLKVRLIYGVEKSYGRLVAWEFANKPVLIRNFFHDLDVQCNKKPSSKGYITLANILLKTRHNVVITTNFDSLVEKAVRAENNNRDEARDFKQWSKYDRNLWETRDGGLELQNQAVYLIRLHRGLDDSQLLNTEEQTRYLPDSFCDNLLDEIFERYSPIILGYSGNDIAFMDYLVRSEKARRQKKYWLAREPERCAYAVHKALDQNGYLIGSHGFDEDIINISVKLSGGAIQMEEYEKQSDTDAIRTDASLSDNKENETNEKHTYNELKKMLYDNTVKAANNCG